MNTLFYELIKEFPYGTCTSYQKTKDLVVEFDDKFEVSIELPGVDKSDLSVEVDNGYLVVKATRKDPYKDTKATVLSSSRIFGEFERKYKLSDTIDNESVDASYVDGILTISLSKQESKKPSKITIKLQESPSKDGLFSYYSQLPLS